MTPRCTSPITRSIRKYLSIHLPDLLAMHTRCTRSVIPPSLTYFTSLHIVASRHHHHALPFQQLAQLRALLQIPRHGLEAVTLPLYGHAPSTEARTYLGPDHTHRPPDRGGSPGFTEDVCR